MKFHLKPAKQHSHCLRQTPARVLTRKELDLLILAGCSCLMTLLYHPVADAFQSTASGANSASLQISTQVQTRSFNSMSHLQVAKPSEHEGIVEEE